MAFEKGSTDQTGLTSAPKQNFGQRILVSIIRFYQIAISPGLPPSCRYYPSCSEYTLQAVTRYGVFKGGWLGIKRLSRCHPFHPGGFDPVP